VVRVGVVLVQLVSVAEKVAVGVGILRIGQAAQFEIVGQTVPVVSIGRWRLRGSAPRAGHHRSGQLGRREHTFDDFHIDERHFYFLHSHCLLMSHRDLCCGYF
jgi:hypothetical protein